MIQQPQPFNRTSFITLNNNRLFTAKEVAYLIKEYTPRPAPSTKPDDSTGFWFTPAEMQKHNTTIRNETLKEVKEHGEYLSMNALTYKDWNSEMKKFLEESLRREVPE